MTSPLYDINYLINLYNGYNSIAERLSSDKLNYLHLASSLDEKISTSWKTDKPRPIQILSTPERIDVTAPIPDYPPMLFRYKGKLHKIKNADGPERIETEWWLEKGQHRDYYSVEDEEGNRYWLFRLGHYTSDQKPQWFIHGFFA